jgi:ABC-type uncharacterized transport system substrate-binding protein
MQPGLGLADGQEATLAVNDPVGQGFVASLARPGGNITGFSFIGFPLIGKWLEIIKEIAPGIRHVTLMFNPDTTPFYPAFLRELGAALDRSPLSFRRPLCTTRERRRQ